MSKAENLITGIHHIAIRANDFDRTLNFYRQALGFRVAHTWSLPEFNLERAAMLQSADGRTFIEVFDTAADIAAEGRKRRPGEAPVQTALLHLCLSTGNAEAAYHQAIAAGATSCIPPMTLQLGSPPLNIQNALVYSPNGEVIEFIEKTEFPVISV